MALPLLRRRPYTILSTGALLSGLIYVRSQLLALERAYPSHSPSPSDPLLRPAQPSQTVPYADIFFAHVPARWLSSAGEPHAAWARAFLRGRTLALEGRMLGGGDAGEAEVDREAAQLVGGAMTVLSPPARGRPLVAAWEMSSAAVEFFEGLSRWGYPFRLMSGGRHTWSVVREGKGEGEEEEMVLVGFGAAHDYEREGDDGKVIPRWTIRVHRAYARWLLREGVEELERRARGEE